MQKRMFATALAAALLCASIPTQAQDNSQKPTAYMVSDAHLDTQWNWDIQTTIREYIWKTVVNNLHLLDNYPEYIFNFEGAQKYAWMKEYYPRQYEEVKKYVENGRWHLTGTSWDASETVIVSPESWLRNTMLGQVYFRQEFGKESTDCFLPDCFGFSYDMPTLAAHCGLIGFSTQKLGWRNNPFYEGNKKYPFTIGLWQGIDGSRIMLTHGFGYGQRYRDEDLSKNPRLLKEIQESPLNLVYRYYGTGDTGGSPDIPTVRGLVKGVHGDGPVNIKVATSDQMYKDFMPYDQHPELPVFDGELYMDVHGVGCYTSQATMKLYNRQNEHLADAAERSAVVAEWLGTGAYPKRDMTESWKRVLLHQFHDDLPGTSIPRAYEFSWNDELISLGRFSNILTTAVDGVSSQLNTQVSGTPVVLVNTEAYPVQTVAEVVLPNMAGSYSVTDHNGRKVASQVVTNSKGERTLLINANVPATGYAVYSVKAAGKGAEAKEKAANAIENSVYKVKLDANGNICSLVDKRHGKELVAEGKEIGLVVFDSCRSQAWPAWEILKHTVDRAPLDITEGVKTALVENGPVRKTLRVERTYRGSTFVQYIRLYEGAEADRIDVYNEVDWHSMNSLLKAQFPLSVSNSVATYDLGLGSVERGNNRENMYEVYSHEWTDLTDASGDYGVTILNDSKYGWDKPADNTIRLSLLWAPEVGRGYAYQQHQDMGHHAFTYSIIGHKGQLDKAVAVKRSTTLNSPLRAFQAPKHKGQLGRSFSFASIDNPNVTVRAIKKAEMSDEDVVRVYENTGKAAQQAKITFAADIVKAVEADGTEKTLADANFNGKTLNVDIKPFSVKTYKVTFKNAAMQQATGSAVALKYNKRCFSFNDFPAGADFEGGNSYAAELLPKEGLDVDGVHFTFGELDGVNGLSCRGDTIAIPEGTTRLYLLAASAKGDRKAAFHLGSDSTVLNIADYTGFVGQWHHEGHTQGFLKDSEVAYVGTHRHNRKGDEVYTFTYMFKYQLEVPAGVKELILPRDPRVTIFAMTATKEGERVVPACRLFRTGNVNDTPEAATSKLPNLLKDAKIVFSTGQANRRERAEFMVDGNENTKWCDVNKAPNYVIFDLGEAKTISSWSMLNAANEEASYVTRTVLLQGREGTEGEWQTLDLLDANTDNQVNRTLEKPATVRQIRLYVVSPTQDGGGTTRIYEFGVY